jgi:hypothetical protein
MDSDQIFMTGVYRIDAPLAKNSQKMQGLQRARRSRTRQNHPLTAEGLRKKPRASAKKV